MTRLVILSGGVDSTAALHRAVADHGPLAVAAVTFDYGQRHARELDAARRIAFREKVPHEIVDITGLLDGSALIDQSVTVPEGHYADTSMAATVVHGRNLLFVSLAAARSQPGDTVILGVHAGDHPIYPDCRPGFIQNLNAVTSDTYGVRLSAPFVTMTKADIIAAHPGAPYSLTWSCYVGSARHCGRCGTCVERREAFVLADVPDPTAYDV